MEQLIDWLQKRINDDKNVLEQIDKASDAAAIIFCSMTTLQSVLEFINNNKEKK